MRVALKRASELAQVESRSRVAKTVMGCDSVKRRRAMTFGENKAVAIGIADGIRPEIEFGAEQGGKKVG